MRCVGNLGLQEEQKDNAKTNLYKMLLYEPGSHYSNQHRHRHRDTDKEPGMFATTVIQLPSK